MLECTARKFMHRYSSSCLELDADNAEKHDPDLHDDADQLDDHDYGDHQHDHDDQQLLVIFFC